MINVFCPGVQTNDFWRHILIYQIDMNDKAIGDALNKAFNGSPNHFNLMKGRNNSLKIKLAEPESIAYCYIDSYQHQKMAELELITVLTSPQKEVKVFKSKIGFYNKFKADRRGLTDIEVSFNPHPTQIELALVHLKYSYSEAKAISKIGLFSFDFHAISAQEDITLEQFPIKKPFVQAQWHPLYDQYLLVLTTEGFEIISFSPDEGFSWKNASSFKQLGVGQPIVDFRFWPSQTGIRQLTIIAAGESGTLHVLLVALRSGFVDLDHEQQLLIEEVGQFGIKKHQTIRHNSALGSIGCLGIQKAVPRNAQFLLLFKTLTAVNRADRTYIISISVLFEKECDYREEHLITIKGEETAPLFEIPNNCFYNDRFHFWCGDKLARVNLKDNIKTIIDPQSFRRSKAFKEIEADVLLEVPTKSFKFLILDSSSIKLLRRLETAHRYLFDTIAVEAADLALEEANACKNLEFVLNKLKEKLQQCKSLSEKESAPFLSTSIKEITQKGDQRQLEDVLKVYNNLVKEGKEKLLQEEEKLENLYQEAKSYQNEFNLQRSRWRELDALLTKIESNACEIEDLQKKSKQDGGEYGRAESIEQMCKCLSQRPLQIDQRHRTKYHVAFNSQLDKLRMIEAEVQQLASQLKQSSEEL